MYHIGLHSKRIDSSHQCLTAPPHDICCVPILDSIKRIDSFCIFDASPLGFHTLHPYAFGLFTWLSDSTSDIVASCCIIADLGPLGFSYLVSLKRIDTFSPITRSWPLDWLQDSLSCMWHSRCTLAHSRLPSHSFFLFFSNESQGGETSRLSLLVQGWTYPVRVFLFMKRIQASALCEFKHLFWSYSCIYLFSYWNIFHLAFI